MQRSSGGHAKQKVALIINGLGAGGLQRKALTLARHLQSDHGIETELVYLKDRGSLVADSATLPGSTWSPKFGAGFDLRGIWHLGARLRQSGFRAVIASNQYATLMALREFSVQAISSRYAALLLPPERGTMPVSMAAPGSA